MKRCRAACLLVLIALLAGTGALRSSAETLEQALTPDLLDVAACRVLHNGQAAPADETALRAALGLPAAAGWTAPWSAGQVVAETKQGDTFQYLVAFKQPVTLGSLLFTTGAAAVLKADAAYPGNPAEPKQWQAVAVPDYQGGVRLAVLPQVVQTRAVLFTDHIRTGRSQIEVARFFPSRLFNVATLASARAKSEYAAPENFGARLYRATDLVRGRGPWQNNGVGALGNITGPFISDVQPSWFVLAWAEPQKLVGLFLQDNFTTLKLDVFTGPATTDPQIAVENEWTAVKNAQFAQRASYDGRWISFAEPLTTRGLRIRILKTHTAQGAVSQIAELNSLLALADLGKLPPPDARAEPPKPPLAIPFKIGVDGTVTMVVDDPGGKRVRNLVARVARPAGDNTEYWDLKDETGHYVSVGTYKMKGLTAPPLGLRYEMSVYPNVTDLHPENTAWLNGMSGPGGWLADHTPPFGGCASGDLLFFGAPVPESGVGFACCDLTGKKLWGISSFDAWSGAWRIAGDGKNVYVENNKGGGGLEDIDRVWAVDTAKQSYRTLLKVNGTEKRRRGIAGMAAREGKLYLAINTVDNYLAGSATSAAVDIEKCVPWYKETRKPKIPYEMVPDARGDFTRLLRLNGTPPGAYCLTYLDSSYSPGKRAHIMVAFNKPVEIGSCVFPVPQGQPYTVKLSVAKPDAPYPPHPDKRDQWLPFEAVGKLPWDVVAAPPNTVTRALLITFDKGTGDDLEEDLEAAPEPKTGADGEIDLTKGGGGDEVDSGAKGKGWKAQLEGLRILRRRFVNRFDTAKVHVNSGALAPDGSWDAQRQAPLTPANPGIYAMEWKTPQSLRGLAIREIDGKLTEIDVYTGPDGQPIDVKGDAGWEKVGQYEQARRDHHSGFASCNTNARYLDGCVDFGRDVTTRAVRLRIVEQWADNGDRGSSGVRPDMGGMAIEPMRCRVYGVAPLGYLGGESGVDPLVAERLEIVDGTSGKIEKDLALRKPGDLVFGPDGALFAVSAAQVVKVNLAGGEHAPVITDLVKPGPVACDAQGNLYVYDDAKDRKNVRVYDAAGKYQRAIGEAGGYQVGPWNPNRFNALTALFVDKEQKLWAVDTTYFPKRVSCWKLDGTFQREYLGPTCYGGAGVLDPYDHRRLFYGPMEFELDWAKGTSRLKNLTWRPEDGWAAGEVPIRVGERTYLVNRPADSQNSMHCGIVYLYEKDHLKRVAAIGQAVAFAPLKQSKILTALGGQALKSLQFVWSDTNGNGEVDFEECVFKPAVIPALTSFNRDLGIQAGVWRFEVKEFLPNGAPVYVEKKLPLPFGGGYDEGSIYKLDNGLYYRMAVGPKVPEAGFSADGKTMWTYKQEGAGVGPNRTCAPYTPGQVVCQFSIVGHETAPEGDLGEFYVVNANLGSWYLWTADGMLATRLFRDLRDPKRLSWTMREHDRGMNLDDITVGEEHFQGWFCRTDNGKYYAVAGHNHASVVEVLGLEKFKRFGGELKVTGEDIRRTQEWEKEAAKFRSRESAKVYDCYTPEGKIGADGATDDWAGIPAVYMEKPEDAPPGRSLAFRMACDGENLYLLYEIMYAGPLKNSGNQWDKLFKTGGCVDLMLATDDQADPARKAPAKGDKRLLMTVFQGKPVAVLYDAVNPEAPKDQRWDVVSPVTREQFDAVRQLPEVRLAYRKVNYPDPLNPYQIGYIFEAVVPLKSVGLVLKPDLRVKMDWGVLETDNEGAVVLSRTYWANKATSTLADAPSEARLEPDMWGYARFFGKGAAAPTGPRMEDPDKLLKGGGAGGGDVKLEEE